MSAGALTYIEYHFKVDPLNPGVDILLAELGQSEFESFVESEDGLKAYVPKDLWNPNILKDLQILKSPEFDISYSKQEIEPTNWNETWEAGFHPIVVDEACTVRAPFHDKSDTQLDIIIEPKMSFGTGHHETTHMMIQFLLKESLHGKTVLDMGCGTGVLAIIAEKLGAQSVNAIDIDRWSYENCIENAVRNTAELITVQHGDASLLKDRHFDVIIANINRNILLEDMGIYAKCLNSNGVLLLSGFYKEDIPLIVQSCHSFMLKLVETIERDQWVALKFIN